MIKYKRLEFNSFKKLVFEEHAPQTSISQEGQEHGSRDSEDALPIGFLSPSDEHALHRLKFLL